MKGYLFNPENDLALAAGDASYTPPRNAALLRDNGAMLPLWYADAGDLVLGSCDDDDWLSSIYDRFCIAACPSLRLPEVTECVPWGWSANAARRFNRAGVAESSLPSDEALARLRDLSHRRITVEVYKRLYDNGFRGTEMPSEADSIDKIRRYAASHSSMFYFKSPWSSTGRGVASSVTMCPDEIERRCAGIISRQGSVMLEPLLDKVLDFAMLFYADGSGTVRFAGYSMFCNNGDAYSGNMLMSDDAIERRIVELTGGKDVKMLRCLMPEILQEIIGDAYTGYFGVDMMVYRNRNGQLQIAPCVEVNLRMTMGVVAHIFRERYLGEDVVNAMLTVEFGDKTPMKEPVVDSGKLVKGDLSLVPPSGVFRISIKIN